MEKKLDKRCYVELLALPDEELAHIIIYNLSLQAQESGLEPCDVILHFWRILQYVTFSGMKSGADSLLRPCI